MTCTPRNASVFRGVFFTSPPAAFRCALSFGAFGSSQKHGRKNLREFFFDRSFGKQSCPSDCASPARSGFTTFCHRKVVPKVSARRKAAGNSQRLAKTGACRGFASKPAPFFNARRCSFLFPHFSQGGDCCALRATMIYYDSNSSILSFSRPRPARSHCENSGSRDVIGASARSDRAKSEVFRDRSASAGVVTRYFSPCLIFWCFWIKPKARKKENVQQKKSILREEFRREDRLRRICGSEPAEARRWGRAPQCCGGR